MLPAHVPRILIVEPEGLGREILIQALESAGHQVTLADDGKDALERWRADRHELAILDQDTTGLSGAELAARMKAETPHVFAPVLLVIPNSDVGDRIAALSVADDVVSRPFWPAELHARAEALLRIRQLVDTLRLSRDGDTKASADGTGLRTRSFLSERLHEEWKRAARYNEPLAFLVLAVDGFGETEKARGGPFSQRLMSAVAQAALKILRQIDVTARYGDGEVAALLPNTHFAGAMTCAERLFQSISRLVVDGFSPTVSMGIAFYPGKDVGGPADLLNQGAAALARARTEGPGRICLVQHQGYLFQPK